MFSCLAITMYKIKEMVEFYSDRAGKMIEWVKVLAAKPDDLNSVPRKHLMEGEK